MATSPASRALTVDRLRGTEDMDVIVESNVIALDAPRVKPSGEQLLLNVLLLAVTVVVVVIGLHAQVHQGLTAVNAVAFGLALMWGVAGLVAARFSDRAVARLDVYATLIGVDALLASVALTVGRLAQNQPAHTYGAERSIATITALLVTAVSFHFLLGPAQRPTAWEGSSHRSHRRLRSRPDHRGVLRRRQATILSTRGRRELVGRRALRADTGTAPVRRRGGAGSGSVCNGSRSARSWLPPRRWSGRCCTCC